MDMGSPPVAAYWHIQHILGRHPFQELNFQKKFPVWRDKVTNLEGFAKGSFITLYLNFKSNEMRKCFLGCVAHKGENTVTSILNELPAGAAPELVRTVGHLAGVMIDIAKRIARGGIDENLADPRGTNLGGDGQKALDVIAYEAFMAALKQSDVQYYASELDFAHYIMRGSKARIAVV